MLGVKPDYRILCGVDGSPGADRALDLIAALPFSPRDEVVVTSYPGYILAARPGGESLAARLAADQRARAREVVDHAIARLAGRGVVARGTVCDGEDSVDALIRLGEEEGSAVIVVGSRGRGPWTSIVLGSTARALATLSPIPVIVVRESGSAPVRVLAATDGSPAACAALKAFGRLPQSEGSAVELLHVLPSHDWGRSDAGDEESLGLRLSVEREEEIRAASVLAEQRALVPPGLEVRTRFERGHVGTTILRRAAEIGADLVVLGTRGLAGRRQLFWGSTAERVLTQARCNVLVAQPPA